MEIPATHKTEIAGAASLSCLSVMVDNETLLESHEVINASTETAKLFKGRK